MKAWTEMTDAERAAAAAKGDAVLLMPVLRTYREVAHALTDAVVDCPLGYHDGRPVAHRATTNADVVAWLQRLARISEAVESIDTRDELTPKSVYMELAAWRTWAMRLLGCSEAYRDDDEDLRNQINAAPEPTAADADRLRRDIGDLRLALLDVPLGGASGPAPAWIVRLHRAACEVAGIGVRESVDLPDSELPETPHPHDATCSRCGTRLMFSARQRGDGLCNPCSRKMGAAADRAEFLASTPTLADRCRAAGLEPSLVLEILRSPEGRAAIRFVLANEPPLDAIPDDALRPGDAWRDPEGTEYVVVPASDIGDRPRWLVGERTTPHHLSGLRTRADLHRKPPVYHPYVLVEKCPTGDGPPHVMPGIDTKPQSKLNGCRNPVFVTGGARSAGAAGTHRAWIELTGNSLDSALVRCTHQDLADVGFRAWLSADLATRFESVAAIRLEVVA